jgi:hypothetical protein
MWFRLRGLNVQSRDGQRHTVEVVGTEIWRLAVLDVPFDVDEPLVREGDGGRLRLVSCIGGTEQASAW